MANKKNAIILGATSGSASIKGTIDALRVQSGENVVKGDFVTYDYYESQLSERKNKTGVGYSSYSGADSNDEGVYIKNNSGKAYLRLTDDICILAEIPYKKMYITTEQYNNAKINSNWKSLVVDANMSISLTKMSGIKDIKDIKSATPTKLNTITFNHWIGVPRLYKVSEAKVLVSFYSITSAFIHSIEMFIYDIETGKYGDTISIPIGIYDNRLASYLNLSSLPRPFLAMGQVGGLGVSGIYGYAEYNYINRYPYNTDAYGIFINENSGEFYISYGSFDMSFAYDNNIYSWNNEYLIRTAGRGHIRYGVIAGNNLKLETVIFNKTTLPNNSGIDTPMSDVRDAGKRYHASSEDIYIATNWSKSPASRDIPIVVFGNKQHRFTEHGSFLLNSHNSASGVAASTSSCYIGEYGDSRYAMFAWIGNYTPVKDGVATNQGITVAIMKNKGEEITLESIAFMECDLTEHSNLDFKKNSGKLVLKKINDGLFLLVLNAIGEECAKVLLIKPYFTPSSTISRYQMSASIVSEDSDSTYIKTISDIALNGDGDFRTNATNIQVLEKTLSYEDNHGENADFAYNPGRHYFYTYKISMLDDNTGRIVEFFVKDKNYSSVEASTSAICKETVIKNACKIEADGTHTKLPISGISTQNGSNLDKVRIKKVSPNKYYTLYKDGTYYSGSGIPAAFKALILEAEKNMLTGSELIEHLNNNYS